MSNNPPHSRPGGYEYIMRCGKGTFGEAWLVRELPSKRSLVMKLVYKDKENDSWKMELEGLKTYCGAISSMDADEKKHLVSILHCGENEDCFFYTMEPADNLSNKEDYYVPKTLATQMNDNRLSMRELLVVAFAVLDALTVLRKHNIVHRDIKPENILFFKGIPQLGDIGLMATQSSSLDLFGTPGFIPPELQSQSEFIPINGGEWDLYAFGKVLYIMDTGCKCDFFPAYSLLDAKAHKNKKLCNLWTSIAADKRADRLLDIEEIRKRLLDIQKQTLCTNLGIMGFLKNKVIVSAVCAVIIIVAFITAYALKRATSAYDSIYNAIAMNDVEAVKFFINNEKTEAGSDGTTPLIYALKIPGISPKIIQYLLANTHDILMNNQESPIETAIKNRQSKEIISILLLQTPKINEIITSNNGNLIHTAIESRDFPTLKELVANKKLSTQIADKSGHVPIMIALHSQQYDIAKFLLEHNAKADYSNSQGITPMHFLQNGSEEIIPLLTSKGAKINAQDTFGSTPLLLAVRRNAGAKVISVLLDAGANPDLQDNEGVSPIHDAVAQGANDIIELLIKNKASVNNTNNMGHTPLIIASIFDRPDALKYLIDKGANINHADVAGRTAIHWAALHNKSGILSILLDSGANRDIKDNLGLTPADLAWIARADHAGKLLPAPSPQNKLTKYRELLDIFSYIKEPISQKNRRTLENLLSDSKYNFNDPSMNRTLFACIDGYPDISMTSVQDKDLVKLAVNTNDYATLLQILVSEPNLDVKDDSGMTPIMHVAVKDNSKMAELFCYKAANINAVDNNGKSWMDIAFESKSGSIVYFAGICMIEFVMGWDFPEKYKQAFDSAARKYEYPMSGEYKEIKQIYNANDFLRVKFMNHNASAVARTLLLGYGSPNIETSIGNYAIMHMDATEYMIYALLKFGAQSNLKNAQGESPLLFTIAHCSKPSNVIKNYLFYGANPLSPSNSGYTPIAAAKNNNQDNLLRLMMFFLGKE